MMKRWIACILGLLFTMITTGCTTEKSSVEYNSDKQVSQSEGNANAYISANGELIYGDVNIAENSFELVDEAVELGIRAQKDIISDIAINDNNEVCCSISTSNGTEFGDKVYIVKEDEIKKTIQLEDGYGASTIMQGQDEIYIQGAVRPAEANPDGVPFVTINTDNDEVMNEFHVKGVVVASVAYKDDMYMMVAEAEKIGYKGFNECYMAKLNHNTKQIEILNDSVEAQFARSMAVTEDGVVYVVDTPMFSEESEVSHLYAYDTEGNFIQKYKLDNWADKIVINDENIAYISHRGATEMYDDAGNTVTVFDLNQGKIVNSIQVDEGPSDLYLYEKYLFVATYTASTVDAINMENNEMIGRIKVDDIYKIDQVIVTEK